MSSSATASALAANLRGIRFVSGVNAHKLTRRRLATTRRSRGGSNGGGSATSVTVHARMGGIIDAAKVADAAGTAIIEVSKAVSMRGVEAPDTQKSYVAKGGSDADAKGGPVAIDEEGLPLVYDKAAIQAFWDKQGGALQRRWGEFLSLSVPFLTRVATLSLTGGAAELSKNDRSLARDARVIIEKLGPTYIKAGQMMSVRPDVLPQAALDELAVLQDAVKPFSTADAIDTIERELGGPLGEFFDEISEAPVAAASLAQVYRARLAGGATRRVVCRKMLTCFYIYKGSKTNVFVLKKKKNNDPIIYSKLFRLFQHFPDKSPRVRRYQPEPTRSWPSRCSVPRSCPR